MAATDLLTAGETRSALNLSGAGDLDATEAALLTAVSTRIDEVFGCMVIRTITDELLCGNGLEWLSTKHGPIETMTTCTVTTTTGQTMLSAGTTSDQVVLPLVKEGQIGYIGGVWPEGVDNIKCTYDAGRVADTASVPTLVKQAAILMMRQLYESDVFATVADGLYDSPSAAFPTIDVPAGVFDWKTGLGLLATYGPRQAVG